MVKTLTAIGDSLALIIDQPLLDLLEIDRDTPLEVTTDGKVLSIRPVARDVQSAFVASAKRMMAIHEETFRKLAE